MIKLALPRPVIILSKTITISEKESSHHTAHPAEVVALDCLQQLALATSVVYRLLHAQLRVVLRLHPVLFQKVSVHCPLHASEALPLDLSHKRCTFEA